MFLKKPKKEEMKLITMEDFFNEMESLIQEDVQPERAKRSDTEDWGNPITP